MFKTSENYYCQSFSFVLEKIIQTFRYTFSMAFPMSLLTFNSTILYWLAITKTFKVWFWAFFSTICTNIMRHLCFEWQMPHFLSRMLFTVSELGHLRTMWPILPHTKQCLQSSACFFLQSSHFTCSQESRCSTSVWFLISISSHISLCLCSSSNWNFNI